VKDYRNIEVQNALKRPLDICIVTYNRPFYLKKCIWSIIASTKCPYRIFVIDDNSTEKETKKFLDEMLERELVHKVIYNRTGKGTATNFNAVIDASDSKLFVMANDDMYFYRYWDFAALDIYDTYQDCGMVTFFDYTRYNFDEGVEEMNDYVLKVPRTGLGATLVNRELYKKAGKFRLPRGRRMGFFATKFCVSATRTGYERNGHYATVPNYAAHMDLRHSKLNERDISADSGYIEHRRLHKKTK